MKIWIDISNAPHVNFFKDFIRDWINKYEVIITTRPLSNTIDLLQKNKIAYNIIGSHYGKNSIAKLIGFIKRSNELYRFLKFQNINVAISQSSFYSPFVARRLKIPSIYTNDNEFAKGNYIAFLFASQILFPEALKEWTNNRFFRNKVSFYPGVKEGIYIKRPQRINDNNKITIYFRPEPWHAQYHSFSIVTFDSFLIAIAKKNRIVILPRDNMQTSHFRKLSRSYSNIEILADVQTVETIAKDCDIFLGAGGSMTREFALMGIPTVSLYQGKLLEVDKYLIDCGILINEKDPGKINHNFINQLIKNRKLRNNTYKIIFDKGKKSRKLINKLINDIAINDVQKV